MWQWNDYNNYLMHYGRKGQRWGQRIFTKMKDIITSRNKKKESNDQNDSSKKNKKKKNIRANEFGNTPNYKLSNAQLDLKIARLKKIQTANSMENERRSAGEKFVRKAFNKMIVDASLEVGKKATKKVMESIVDKYIFKSDGKSNSGKQASRDDIRSEIDDIQDDLRDEIADLREELRKRK